MTPLLTCRTLALFTLLVLAACSPPQPPEKERPPEPTAAHTGLRDAIKEPLDKAKGVEADLQKAADEQQKAIDAATVG